VSAVGVRTVLGRTGRWIALAGCLALLLTGCGGQGPAATGITKPDNHGYHGTYVSPPYDVPAVQLTDNSGAPFTLATDTRPVQVVFFGYTNCPDVCKVVMGAITSAYLRLPAADRDKVRVLFVSTDPARDTEGALTTYLARFHPDFVGLTGPIDQIDQLGKPMGIFIKKGEKLPSGGYEVSHTTSVLGLSHGKVPLVWSGSTSPTDLAADFARLLASAKDS
jgi:protein SCO1/2